MRVSHRSVSGNVHLHMRPTIITRELNPILILLEEAEEMRMTELERLSRHWMDSPLRLCWLMSADSSSSTNIISNSNSQHTRLTHTRRDRVP